MSQVVGLAREGAVNTAKAQRRHRPILPGSTGSGEAGLGLDGLLVVAAIAAATVGQGGYYRRESAVCGLLLGAAGVAMIVRRNRALLHSLWPARWALVGLGAMAACTLLASAFDGHVSNVTAPIALLLGLAVIVAVAAACLGPDRRQLADLLITLGVFLGITAWIGVAFHLQPLGRPESGVWRAATTVTYENASAAILAPLALWALARATVRDAVVGRLAIVVLLTGLGATWSRAGIGSFVVGCAVLVALVGYRAVWRAAWRPVAGAVIAVVGLAPGLSVSGPARPVWAVLGLIAGLGVGAATRRATRRHRSATSQASSHPGLTSWSSAARVLMAVAAVAIIGVLVGFASQSRSWSGRLSLASSDRTAAASAALHLWHTHLAWGVGPGEAVFVWTDAQHQLVFDRYAHDEYLQVAAEEGLAGLAGVALLAAGVAVTAALGWRASRRSGTDRRSTPDAPMITAPTATAEREDDGGRLAGFDSGGDLRALRAGAIAGLICLALHSGFDFVWHVPAVVMLGAVGVGLAAPDARTGAMSQTAPQQVRCSGQKP
jgi:hypothetical protein